MFKKIFENKKAAIFDLDGTILDTKALWVQALDNVLKGLKVDWIYIPDIMEPGAALEETWNKILADPYIKIDIPKETLINNTYTQMIKIIAQTAELIPKEGFWPLVYELKEEKKYKTVLVTNSPKIITNALIAKSEIQKAFDFILTAEDVTHKKPDPEIYKKAIKLLDLKPEEIIVFEDSVIGSTAAVRAKLTTIIIWDGETIRELYSPIIDVYVPDFSDFPGNLDKTYVESIKEGLENQLEL